ncbi:hypothetical protein KJ632_03200 [Patescibacteria group bacterium]|nr:hypothetical protein [Patescibacteria group bacterium]
MLKISSNFKNFGKSLEKQFQDSVKNHKIKVECPKCKKVFYKSLKEMKVQEKMNCDSCSTEIAFNLSEIDKKFL